MVRRNMDEEKLGKIAKANRTGDNKPERK